MYIFLFKVFILVVVTVSMITIIILTVRAINSCYMASLQSFHSFISYNLICRYHYGGSLVRIKEKKLYYKFAPHIVASLKDGALGRFILANQ